MRAPVATGSVEQPLWGHHSLRMRKLGVLWLVLSLPFLASAAYGDTLTVRLGDLTLRPYVLLQLDEGGTLGQTRGGGQGTSFNLRRARVGAQATIADQFSMDAIWDFGGTPDNHSSLYAADLAYIGFKPFVIRGGVYKWPFTLEYSQSATDILFLERASIVNIVGGLVAGADRVGGQFGAARERWFAAVFLTGGRTGPGARSGQRAVLGRAAGLVIKTDNAALHLGISGAWLYRVPSSGGGVHTIDLSDQPELQIDNVPPSLSTGPIAAQSALIGGPEVGLGWDRLWLQSEWYGIRVERSPSSAGFLFFSGWYAQAAYTLIGKPRQYRPSVAAWGSPSPVEKFNPATGSWGAIEVGARFSTVNLNDQGVRGGRQRVSAAVINWYPADPLRFSLEYAHADVAGGEAPRSLNFVALRGQLFF
jgi:phosphate-selective porin OprO and OprP